MLVSQWVGHQQLNRLYCCKILIRCKSVLFLYVATNDMTVILTCKSRISHRIQQTLRQVVRIFWIAVSYCHQLTAVMWLVKPKFHYAHFATKSATSSRQSRGHKSWKSATQITSPTFMICVSDFVGNLLRTLSRTLSPTFLVHCNRLNSIRASQTGLSWTCYGLCRKHLNMSR